MLELRIISPQENGFVQEIEWNNEELKTAIAKKMEDYKGLVFTEETIADGKKDRADLNKLRGAIDNERKRIKKMCMEPYDKFEKEVKEVLGLVDEQINAIDVQIKEVEQIKREEKRKTVQELFESIGFQKFVTLEMIWDEKWLNASVSSDYQNLVLKPWKSIRRHWILRRQSRKDRSWLTFRRERKKRLPDRKLRKREEKQRKLLQEKSQRIRKMLRILMMRLKKLRRMTIQELFQNRS